METLGCLLEKCQHLLMETSGFHCGKFIGNSLSVLQKKVSHVAKKNEIINAIYVMHKISRDLK